MDVSVEITKSSDFVHIYAIGAIGGHSPYDFMIAFYNASTKNRTGNDKQVTSREMEMTDGTNSHMAAPAALRQMWPTSRNNRRTSQPRSRGIRK